MTQLAERWRAFDDRTFPGDARGEINGANLNSIHTFASMLIDKFLTSGTLEMNDIGVLQQCRDQIARALPALAEYTREYFAELDAIMAQAIGDAATDPFKFTNVTGLELNRLLERRVAERLASRPGQERFQAMLGAALIVVADTLQGPVRAATDPKQAADRMIELCANWLRNLLEPAITGGQQT